MEFKYSLWNYERKEITIGQTYLHENINLCLLRIILEVDKGDHYLKTIVISLLKSTYFTIRTFGRSNSVLKNNPRLRSSCTGKPETA